ncbi:MAG TPA: hypothetical protein PKD51_11380 [Saprospiraceae bacterium]|nr:hypothetical protein [Saprospiraceae bacterium]
MKILNTFILFLLILFNYSCEPISRIRLVKDRVKNTETYQYELNKSATSKIAKTYQTFKIEFIKMNTNEGMIDMFISTNRFPANAEFNKDTYFLAATLKIEAELLNIRQVPITEHNTVNQTNTTYHTTTSHVPVTTTVQKIVNDVPVTETKTDIQVVQSQVPVQNNYHRVTESSYIAEKFKISIPKETLENLCTYSQFTLRLYDQDNDFWNIDFNNYNVTDIKNLLNNKVDPYNISHN